MSTTWIEVSGVVLDGVKFNTDPDPYEPYQHERRYSEHMTIRNPTELKGVVIQDFGVVPQDNMLVLGSGKERFMAEDVVTQLEFRYRMLGKQFFFSDWLGNQFMVFMRNFKPVPFKRGGDGSGGTISLYTYNMELKVTGYIKTYGRLDSGV